MKWIKKTYLQCIPLRFGVCLSFNWFFSFFLLYCVHRYIHNYTPRAGLFVHTYIHIFVHTYIYLYIHTYIHILYLNTIRFKAQSLWSRQCRCNRCYLFHRTKWRLLTSICRGPGPVATRMPFFSPEFKSTANFSAPTREGNLFFLSGRSARKKIHNVPINSSHLWRTSRHVWLSASTCDHCRAYQLICIMTIGTYTTGARV